MKINDIWQEVAIELTRAKKQHRNWPDHICGQAGIVVKETGELMQGCVDLKYATAKNKEAQMKQKEHIKNEAVQVITTAIRFLENLK